MRKGEFKNGVIDADGMSATKVFKGFLIMNWRSNKMRIVMNRPSKSKLSPHDIILKININVNVPKLTEVEIKGDFVVPPVQVKEAMLRDL